MFEIFRFAKQLLAASAICIIAANVVVAHDVKSIYVKLFVAPADVAANPSKLGQAWNQGTAFHAVGDIYYQLTQSNGTVIDQGKVRLKGQGRLKKLSSSEVARASEIYIGTENTGKRWRLDAGRPEGDGTAVLNFVVTDGTPGYRRVDR